MKTNRRDFIKISTIAGMTMAGEATIASPKGTKHTAQGQAFNMSGYAAPKIETVRIGFIGLGNRGPGAVERISKIDGVEIKALCDIRPEKAEAAKKLLEKTPHKPDLYSGGAEEWKKVCDRKDIDLIYIATPW